MGLTFIDCEVFEDTSKKKTVSFLVDSGAVYSLLPYDIWQELQLKPKRVVTVSLADGTKLTRAVSECKISVQGIEGTSPVILGEPGDGPLLGAVTLENLGLILDPYKRTLQPLSLRV